jgi:predicted nucleic acid-binding protein
VGSATEMLLTDTSVWIHHLRRDLPALREALEEGTVAVHPFVIGELACGSIRDRQALLDDLSRLPTVQVAEHHEVLHLVERWGLAGRGLGWLDCHLLASARLAGTHLWTLDRALGKAWQAMAR